MKDTIFREMTIPMMKDRYDVSTLDDQLLLADNLHVPDITTSEIISSLPSSNPMKINFTLSILCVEGSMDFAANVEEMTLKRNEMTTLPPGTLGEFKSIQKGTKILIICAKPTNDNGRDADVAKGITTRPIITLADSEVQDIISIYEMTKRKLNDEAFSCKKEFVMAMTAAMASIGKNKFMKEKDLLRTMQGKPGARAESIFLKFMAEVKENHASERMISFYADKCCVTPKYLSQVVHEVSGKFASEWIKSFVIIDSKVLLRSKRYTVQQVADMMGFDNASFFGKYFKAATGLSPRAYMLKP